MNDLSDMEDEGQGGQKSVKLSDIYSTTIPSVDSAVESWDGSAIDATFSTQGKLCVWLFLIIKSFLYFSQNAISISTFQLLDKF